MTNTSIQDMLNDLGNIIDHLYRITQDDYIRIVNLQEQLEDNQNRLDEAISKSNALEEKERTVRADVDKKLSILVMLENDLKEQEKKQNIIENNLEQRELLITGREEKCNKIEKENSSLQYVIRRDKEEKNNLREEANKIINKQNEIISEKNEIISEKNYEIDKINKIINKKDNEINGLEFKLAQLEQRNYKLNNELNDKEKHRKEEDNEESRKYKTDNYKLKVENQKLSKENEQLKKQISGYKSSKKKETIKFDNSSENSVIHKEMVVIEGTVKAYKKNDAYDKGKEDYDEHSATPSGDL